MRRYIELDDLVAEIERRINEINLDSIEDWRYRLQREHDIEVMKNILSLINTLETKEVDLDKEYECYMNEEISEKEWIREDYLDFAKHFYELGLNSRHES